MSFAYPAVLALLALPIWLLVREWRARGRRLVLPFDHGDQKRGTGLRILLSIAGSFPALLLAAVIVILAGPQQLTEPRTKRSLTNIEFCIDVSGSMTSPFGEGSRYDAAMASMNEFINYRDGDAFGLTIFGSSVLHWVPLTSDPSAFQCAPPFLSPMVLPRWFGGGTMIGMGLTESLKVLESREEGDRMIILISDGYSFDLSGGNDERIARNLRDENVVVYAIHIAEGAPPEELYTLATLTDGQVFSAGDPEALKAVFKRIDGMQVVKLEKTAPETMDDFAPFCIAALSFLGLSAFCMLGLRVTPW